VRVEIAFTPGEAVSAALGIVVDVLREDALDVLPRFARMIGPAAEIVA
jgi:hypothetical protein